MDTLADSDLLHLWETMRRQTLPRRAAALLAVAAPDLASGRLAGLSLGERERRLLDLHAHCFGARLACVADCPQCGEAFEFELDARALAAGLPVPAEAAPTRTVESGDLRVEMRLPTVADSIALADEDDVRHAYSRLLDRCLACTTRTGEAMAPQALPPALLEEAAAWMEAADPAAELMISMACPACDAVLGEPIDLAAFCWAEVEARAPRLLAEVDALASRYGWSEADILSMSRVRRDAYLALVLS
ncbi:hypothetical protein [Variovorax ginsengisoli]|uniref:Phage baseplate protein n=1 Tax=Variovorax ginsengisoli TaxID=363844 RepID=A0ABT8S697_9BURK|nr:hypothetical protein [Variovorax ginsengisoli]MDN8615100.1 hypothetical protein [Variovorax ginsengisoli]MDO1534270.1 hypothetical protein [Variovorax ginsengisoli]